MKQLVDKLFETHALSPAEYKELMMTGALSWIRKGSYWD